MPAVIKPTRRELLKLLVERGADRLRQQMKEQATNKDALHKDYGRFTERIADAFTQIGHQQHAAAIRTYHKAAQLMAGASFSVRACSATHHLAPVDPKGETKLTVSVNAHAEFPITVHESQRATILALDEERQELARGIAEADKAIQATAARLRDYSSGDVMADLIQNLPEEAGPLLDQLTEMVLRCQTPQE